MATTGEKRTVLIVTAGLPRSGKSTAMNNIFGADFKSEWSASSVTSAVEARCVDGLRNELIVVDTPGLAATDIKFATIKKDLLGAIGGLNFVLVYCYSVGPTNSQTKADVLVAKNLQKVLGKDVWKKCVVLFTCSDLLREQEYPREGDREKYKDLLQRYASRFSEMLRKECGSHVPDVKVVFDVDTEQEDVTEIVAVPVGRKLKCGRERYLLLPGMKETNWKVLALCEILRKADPIDQQVFLSFGNDLTPVISFIAGGVISGVVGGIAGGAVGAVVGAGAGGFGAIPGAVIGTGVGVATGVIAGGAYGSVAVQEIGLAMEKRKERARSKRVDKLKNAKHIPYHSAATDEERLQSNASDAESPDIESSIESSLSVSTATPFLASTTYVVGKRIPVQSKDQPNVAAEEPEP